MKRTLSLIQNIYFLNITASSDSLTFGGYVHNMAYRGLDPRKPVFGRVPNNKGADQPAHPRSLISAFVICLLESTISKHASIEFSIF